MQTQLQSMLPVSANFMRLVELRRTIEGNYPLAMLDRLCEVLLSNEGVVSAKLEFGHSVGFACLKAKTSATLSLKCQRCLEPMETTVTGNFKLALLDSEDEFELVPDEFEPYLLEGEEQSVIDLIEDELLLSLPMVVVHEEACSDYMNNQQKTVNATNMASGPFAALQALKDELGSKAK